MDKFINKIIFGWFYTFSPALKNERADILAALKMVTLR
jgi:hypothetical protein